MSVLGSNTRVILCCCVAVIPCAWSVWGGTEAGDAHTVAPEIRVMAAGIEHNRSKFVRGQAFVNWQRKTPKEFFDFLRSSKEAPPDLPVSDEEMSETGRWYFYEGNLSVWRQPGTASGGSNGDRVQERNADVPSVLQDERLVANRDEARLLQQYRAEARDRDAADRKYHIGVVAPSGVVVRNGIWEDHEDLDPRYYAYYYGGQPLDQQLLGGRNPVSFAGESLIDGSQCMKAEMRPTADSRWVFFVDRQHGYIMRRFEGYRRVKGRFLLTREVQLSNLVESGGLWVPGLVDVQDVVVLQARSGASGGPAVVGRIKIENGVAVLPAITKRVTITHFSAGVPVPPEVFILEWPVGTAVQDQINRREFRVQAVPVHNGEQEPVESGEVRP